MFGEKALDLIRELHRNKEGTLGPYDEEKVRQVIEEVRSLMAANSADVNRAVGQSSGEIGDMSALEIRHHGMKRNQRCLVAYLYNRLEKIRTLRWEFGSVIPSDIKENMSELENQYFMKYNRTLADYMSAVGVDLTQNLKPPASLFIEVRCVENRGEVLLDNGRTVLIRKNSILFLPRSQCESLIREGALEHVT